MTSVTLMFSVFGFLFILWAFIAAYAINRFFDWWEAKSEKRAGNAGDAWLEVRDEYNKRNSK